MSDAEAIAAAIERKRALWSKAHDDRSKHLLLRVGDVRAALLDATQCDVYRAFARSEQARLADLARERLAALVDTLAQSMREGAAVIPAELARLTDSVKPIPPPDVRSALQAAGLRLADPGQQPNATRKVGFERIDDLLDLLGKRDLYDMLSLPPSASLTEIIAKADAEFARVDPKPAKNVEKLLVQKLVGDVKVIFKSEADRRTYDTQLADAALRPLDAHIELLGRRERCITADQLALLKARATKMGSEPRAAEDYILRYCEAKDLLVYTHAGAARRGQPPQVFCAHCGTLARSPDQHHCRHCGRALSGTCFSCGRPVYAMDLACVACGFAVADAAPFEAKLADARAASSAGDSERAAQLLRELLTRWPGHAPALEALAAATTRTQQVAAARMGIDSSLAQRHVHAADKALLAAVASFGAPAFEPQRTQVQAARAQAAGALGRGREALRRGQLDEAEAQLDAVLRIAADDAEAQALLDAIPVDAPRQAKATRQGVQVRLRWEAGAPGTRYRVLRRVGAPATPEDATTLGEPTELEWVDGAPPRGLPLHYAVIALRRGRASPLAATGPVLVPDAPADFNAVAGDGQVQLRWRLPRGASGVELRATPQSGPEERWQLGGDGYLHRGLRTGEPVDYTLAALFPDPAGGTCSSAPARQSATPSVALEPVRGLTAAREGSAVVFSWQPPPLGRTEIRLLNGPLAHPAGARVSVAELATLGRALPMQAASPGRGRAELGTIQGELARFVAVTVDASSATIGATANLLILDPVRDVTTSVSGRFIVVRWTWPAAGDQVDVAWRFDRAPESPTDPQASSQSVSRENYRRQGAFRIPAEAERPHHIALWVRGREAGHWSDRAVTCEAMGATVEVRYRTRKRAFGSARYVELSGPAGTVLSNVEIYAREGRPPVARAEGMRIAQVATLTLAGGKAEVDASAGSVGSFVKVFCDDPATFRLSGIDKNGERL